MLKMNFAKDPVCFMFNVALEKFIRVSSQKTPRGTKFYKIAQG